MSATVTPLCRGRPLPEGRNLLSAVDIRRITEHGYRLMHRGRASGVRRFTGHAGNEVVVILDNDGGIKFGIEKGPGGYLCFDCDCETIAAAQRLDPLLDRFS